MVNSLGIGQYSRLRHARGARSIDVQKCVLVLRLVGHHGVVRGMLIHLLSKIQNARSWLAVELEEFQLGGQLVADFLQCWGGNMRFKITLYFWLGETNLVYFCVLIFRYLFLLVRY